MFIYITNYAKYAKYSCSLLVNYKNEKVLLIVEPTEVNVAKVIEKSRFLIINANHSL